MELKDIEARIDLVVKNKVWRKDLKNSVKKVNESFRGVIKGIEEGEPEDLTSNLMEVGYKRHDFLVDLHQAEKFEDIEKEKTDKLWKDFNMMIFQKEKKVISKLKEIM